MVNEIYTASPELYPTPGRETAAIAPLMPISYLSTV